MSSGDNSVGPVAIEGDLRIIYLQKMVQYQVMEHNWGRDEFKHSRMNIRNVYMKANMKWKDDGKIRTEGPNRAAYSRGTLLRHDKHKREKRK